VNFNLAPKEIGPVMQRLAMLALKLSAQLPPKSDQTSGLAAKMADDGYDRIPGVPSVSNRNVLYVIGLYGYELADGVNMGYRIEFLLNGQYFALKTGYQAPTTFGDALPAPETGYPPLSITAIAQPTAVSKNVGRVDKVGNPPPINEVGGNGYGMRPMNGTEPYGINNNATLTNGSAYSQSPHNATTNTPAAPYGLHGKVEVGRYGVENPINNPYGVERPV
jgi:hypothetical protein